MFFLLNMSVFYLFLLLPVLAFIFKALEKGGEKNLHESMGDILLSAPA